MPLNVQPDAVKREASRLFREDGIIVEPTHHKENIEKEDSCRTSEGKSVWNTLSCPCRTLLGAAGQGAAPKRDAHVLPPRTRERKRIRKGCHQRDRVKGVERKRDPQIAWVTCVLTGGNSGGGGEVVCRQGEDPVTRLQAGD